MRSLTLALFVISSTSVFGYVTNLATRSLAEYAAPEVTDLRILSRDEAIAQVLSHHGERWPVLVLSAHSTLELTTEVTARRMTTPQYSDSPEITIINVPQPARAYSVTIDPITGQITFQRVNRV